MKPVSISNSPDGVLMSKFVSDLRNFESLRNLESLNFERPGGCCNCMFFAKTFFAWPPYLTSDISSELFLV